MMIGSVLQSSIIISFDYVGQFRALRKNGYAGVLSLETHWRGGGSPEESTRRSMAGMKTLLGRAGIL